MMPRYTIQDWAGNDLSDYYGTFESFEDAWGAIYERFEALSDKEFDDEMQEYAVIEWDSTNKVKPIYSYALDAYSNVPMGTVKKVGRSV